MLLLLLLLPVAESMAATAAVGVGCSRFCRQGAARSILRCGFDYALLSMSALATLVQRVAVGARQIYLAVHRQLYHAISDAGIGVSQAVEGHHPLAKYVDVHRPPQRRGGGGRAPMRM